MTGMPLFLASLRISARRTASAVIMTIASTPMSIKCLICEIWTSTSPPADWTFTSAPSSFAADTKTSRSLVHLSITKESKDRPITGPAASVVGVTSFFSGALQPAQRPRERHIIKANILTKVLRIIFCPPYIRWE